MTSVTRAADAAAALAELARLATEQQRLATALQARPELIRTARAAGITWPDIAEAANVSRITAINLGKQNRA